MTSLTEQVLEKFKDLVDADPVLTGHVYRGRVYQIESADLPAVLIQEGPEQILEFLTQDQELVETTVYLDLISAGVTDELAADPESIATGVETEVHAIEVRVTKALAANHTLGLTFVQFSELVSKDQIESTNEGDRPVGSQRMDWRVVFYRKRTDPEQALT